jgi:hypothetical protein
VEQCTCSREIVDSLGGGVCFGVARDGQLLTRGHSKEEGPRSQLMGGVIEGAVIVAGQLADNARGEGLLGTGRRAAVFVALQLVQ